MPNRATLVRIATDGLLLGQVVIVATYAYALVGYGLTDAA